MHIKDLNLDVELDRAALAAIHGGSCSGIPGCSDDYPQPHGLPSFDGDWSKFHTELVDYIENAQPDIPDLGDPLEGSY